MFLPSERKLRRNHDFFNFHVFPFFDFDDVTDLVKNLFQANISTFYLPQYLPSADNQLFPANFFI